MAPSSIPNDAEATLERARLEGRELIRRGVAPIRILRARLKLPSGVVGYRYYWLDPYTWGLTHGGASELVEILGERVRVPRKGDT